MTTYSRRPIEVFSSKRRASTAGSTGLDYPTCYRVDEDILSRIRSLLLARNVRCPPRTPFTSDEDRQRHSEHCRTSDTSDRFDFSTAKSVTRLLVRTQSGGLGFPIHLRSRSATFRMDGARRPTQPSISVPRCSLRATSSTNDLNVPQDDADLHAALLPCCPPCPPEGTKKPFRLPRLVLREKSVKKKRDTNFRSCIDFTPRTPPANDNSTKKPDVPCCPPYDVPASKPKDADPPAAHPKEQPDPPRQLSGKTVKAEPADLACFLAGCGPGECKTHRRRSSQPVSPKKKRSINTVDKDIADDMAKLALTAMAVKQFSSAARNVNSRAGSETAEIEYRKVSPANARPGAIQRPKESGDIGTTERKELDLIINGSPLMRSPRSSDFSLDVFPHVAQSQEVAAKASLEQSLSSTVVTNFSLSGPKPKIVQIAKPTTSVQRKSFDESMPMELESVRAKFFDSSSARIPESSLAKHPDDSLAPAMEALRNKQSNASLKSKPYSPSLRSGASKTGSIRHALLKPSVSAEPVDPGLPIPPVLSQVVIGSSEGVAVEDSEQGKDVTTNARAKSTAEDGKDHSALVGVGLELSAAAENFGHMTSLRKAKILVNRVNDRVSETKEWPRAERAGDQSSATVVQHSVAPAEVSEPASNPTSSPGNNVETAMEPTLRSITSLKSLLAAPDSQNTSVGDPRKSACCPDPTMPTLQKVSGVDPRKSVCCPGIVMEPVRRLSAVDPVNAAYWGFVPAVKEAVQNAVQVAVRQAVHEIVVPPGTQQKQASDAYRKLLGDSLAESAKDADDYLRRPSLWNEPSSSIQGRSEGDLEFEDSAQADQEPLMAGELPRGEPSDVRIPRQDDLGLSASPKQPKPSARKSNHIRGKASPDDLETVTLETVDERLVENHKQGWKTLDAWNSLGKTRSSGYTVIPTRSSSKNRARSSKSQTTPNSSEKESPKGRGSRKRSIEKLRSKMNRGFGSESSVGSLHNLGSGGRDQTCEQDSITKGLSDAKMDRSSVSKKYSAKRLGRKNTVHWLRELLSSNGLYETRLTALPPRTRRDENSSTGRIRSQTSPAKPVKELYLGDTPKPDQASSVMPNTTNRDNADGAVCISSPSPDNGKQQTAALTQAFAKTINDLEFLLNEALFIARQAAEREDSAFAPRLLGRATAVLKRGRRGVGDEIGRWENASSVASMHESFGSFSSSDSEDSDEGKEHKKGASDHLPLPELCVKAPPVGIFVSTGLTQTSHHDAGWPPTGRVPTPYPPATPLDDSGLGSSGESPSAESGGDSSPMKDPTARARLATIVTTSSGPGERVSRNAVSGSVQIRDVNPFLAENVGNERKKSAISSEVSPTKRSRSTTGRRSRQAVSSVLDDLALTRSDQEPTPGPLPIPSITPRGASLSKTSKWRATETDPEIIRANFPTHCVPTKREVREYIKAFRHPPIQQRASSLNLRKQAEKEQAQLNDESPTGQTFSWQNIDPNAIEPCSQDEIPDPAQTGDLAKPNPDRDRASTISKSFDGSHPSDAIHFDTGFAHRQHGAEGTGGGRGLGAVELRDSPGSNLPQVTQRGGKGSHLFNLKGRNHISLRGEHHKGFSFARTHKKPKIARDWAPARKRFVATVACISTALVGLLVGIYAAEVPAIQYWIVDFHHYTILGNVFFFIGLSIPTFFFWPLPLLHGRKPYTLGAMSLAMPLLFPQALAVGQFRSPYVDYWRIGLIMPRALMGFVLGFANMNFKSTLTDLFGASLQSEDPHQEVVDENDVRRHGGGLGVWLGIWTWCAMGSIGVGFLFGAIIINHANPAWGFYISIVIIACVLVLNVICPEVRRSAFRRSVAEMKHEEGVSRRLGRGEVKMHLVHTGPKWWGEEFHYGVKLNAKMLRQPGFMVLAVYVSWIYGQIVLLVVVRIIAKSLTYCC